MNPTLKIELIVCLTDHTWTTADIETTLPEIELAEEGVLLGLLLKSGWWKGESDPESTVEIAFVGIYHIESDDELGEGEPESERDPFLDGIMKKLPDSP